ncbi:MAG: VWA domain-containing protein [Terracidiphilus sp.]
MTEAVTALAVLAATFPIVGAYGQTDTPGTGQSPAPKVNAHEVSIDLVVRDRNKPVVDLKPGDLAVTDNGSPVTFTSLRLVNGKSGDDDLITLLFDRPKPSAMQSVRDAAAQILKIMPAQGFSIAVLNVDERLRLCQRFTSDRKLIEQGLRAATEPESPRDKPKTSGNLSSATVYEEAASPPEQELISVARTGSDSSGKPVSARDRALSQTLFSALENAGHIAQEQRIPPSFAGIMALVRSQQQIAQRRSILYFTHGWPMDSRAKEALQSLIGDANRIGVSIYVVDMKALDRNTYMQLHHESFDMLNSGSGFKTEAWRDVTGNLDLQLASIATAASNPVDAMNDRPLEELAESTGGSYVGADENLRKSLQRMIQEMSIYYEARYIPPVQDYDGSFRSVVVKPLRAGLAVRTNSGYFALPPNSGSDIRPFEVPLLRILNGQELPADIAFHAAVLRLGELPNLDGDLLAIELPLKNAEIREDTSTGLYYAHLSILAQVKDGSGNVLETFSEDLPRRGALEEIETARNEVITFQRHFNLPPGAYFLNAAILDSTSEKAGAQRIAFEIPNPAPLSLSDLVLVRRMESLDAKADPLEPMRHGNERVMADISGQVPEDAKQVSVFFTTHPDPKATEQAARTIQLFRDGKALRSGPATPTAIGSANATSLVTFPMNQLRAGNYEVKVTISQGGNSVESAIAFTVAGSVGQTANSEEDDADLPVLEVGTLPAGPLKIETSEGADPPPTADELKSILADATRRANEFSESLPNFMCAQVTDRSTLSRRDGKWRHRDNYVELLEYRDGNETRTMLELNGSKSDLDQRGIEGMISYGEFGGVLKSVFQPSSKADFQWRSTGTLGDGTVQIFDYKVARENSTFDIGPTLHQVVAGFHGQVFIDSATRSVRRITMVADEMDKFPLHATSVSLDYDYILINNHDYLLPVGGEVSTRLGRSKAILNQIEFRDYRRFGSNARILNSSVDPK